MNLWKASDILVGRSGLCVWTKPFNCEPNVLSFCFLFTHFAAALMAEFPSGIRKVMTGGGGRGGEWDQAAVVWWGLGLSWPELRPACRSSTRWSPDRPGRLGWWAYRELEASSLAGHLQHAHTHTHIYLFHCTQEHSLISNTDLQLNPERKGPQILCCSRITATWLMSHFPYKKRPL